MTQTLPTYSTDAIASLRLPPHSTESEQAVLGALMMNNEVWDRIGDIIGAEAFYRHDHRMIYDAISRLIEANKEADVITVAGALNDRGDLTKVGGVAYLQNLVDGTASTANARAYAEVVREQAIKRKLAQAGEKISDECYSPNGQTASDLLRNAETSVLDISQAVMRTSDTFTSLSTNLGKSMEQLDERSKNPGKMSGISTGFADLDHAMDGMGAGDLIIVAGRPSMGKTTFALNIGEHVAIVENNPVLVFSMEMNGVQLANRTLSSQSGVDATSIKTGKLNDRDWDRLNQAMVKLNEAPLQIDETPNLSASEVRARARRMARNYGGIGLIVIDYLQLMRVGGGDNRAQALGDISAAMKALAKELQCPVILLSQLNRELEKRVNKRPVMSDLRDSGAIEQDADVILFIYRDEVYHEESPDRGTAEIIIAKQRNGPTGTQRLACSLHVNRFNNLAPTWVREERKVTAIRGKGY